VIHRLQDAIHGFDELHHAPLEVESLQPRVVVILAADRGIPDEDFDARAGVAPPVIGQGSASLGNGASPTLAPRVRTGNTQADEVLGGGFIERAIETN